MFAATNVIISVLLLGIFVTAGRDVCQTFPVARMAALNNLQPQPDDYFLTLAGRAPGKDKVHGYLDYYECLLQVFPNLWDAYGMMGYCYHYLGDDEKAVRYLKIAIRNYPGYFWNYYNLAAIYINQGNYDQAVVPLKEAIDTPGLASLKVMFASVRVYLPLMQPDEKKALTYAVGHLKRGYRSAGALAQFLAQAHANPQTPRPFNLELYAF